MRHPLLLLALGLAALLTAQDRTIQPIRPRRQVALVIGNGAYRNRPLANPPNDARDTVAMLEKLNFETQLLVNGDRKSMATAIDAFINRLGPGDVALFYYSGHGVQIDGENYLIPIDFTGQNETDVRYDTHAAGRIQDRMERSGAQLNIIVLDACRDNPFRGSSRGGPGGLAAMTAGRGTFVAFSTAPGRTASDNPQGRNGLFTQYLLQALPQPGLGLDDVFNVVRERVVQASAGQQLPWSQSAVVGRYTFVPASDKSLNLPSPLETKVGSGIAPFRFGMSPQDVSAHFQHPLNYEWTTLPVATEYRASEVRYYWLPLSEFPLPSVPGSGFEPFRSFQSCWAGQSYLAFFFDRAGLQRISLRFSSDCGNRDADTQVFANSFDIPAVTGDPTLKFRSILSSTTLEIRRGPNSTFIEVFRTGSPQPEASFWNGL